MKLVVGLGNPGPRYADTRHNVGVRVLERFAREHGLALDARRFGSRFGSGWLAGGEPRLAVALLAPETFMNRSGEAVAEAVAELGLADVAGDLLVVLDDVDLPFGRLRLRAAGGAGGHRGLADVIVRLARQRLRAAALRGRAARGGSGDRRPRARGVLGRGAGGAARAHRARRARGRGRAAAGRRGRDERVQPRPGARSRARRR